MSSAIFHHSPATLEASSILATGTADMQSAPCSHSAFLGSTPISTISSSFFSFQLRENSYRELHVSRAEEPHCVYLLPLPAFWVDAEGWGGNCWEEVYLMQDIEAVFCHIIYSVHNVGNSVFCPKLQCFVIRSSKFVKQPSPFLRLPQKTLKQSLSF